MQDFLNAALRGLFYVVQVWLFFFWLYWMFISLFGFKSPKPMKDYPPTKRFLILIPAHNEEKVIKNLVENLLHLDYPRELYDIYVIADNCTDRTAEISRQAGAKVIEHYSKPGEPRGKPYALKYAFEVLDDQLDNYDAFCVFDADNLVSLNYLREMNKNLMNGDKLIQST